MTDEQMTHADYEADRAEAYIEEQAELDAERRSYEEGREPPPQPPRVLATFAALPDVTWELLDDEVDGLVLAVEVGTASRKLPLAGLADALVGPLLDQLERDTKHERVAWMAQSIRIQLARDVLGPVLERPTDPDPPDPEPF